MCIHLQSFSKYKMNYQKFNNIKHTKYYIYVNIRFTDVVSRCYLYKIIIMNLNLKYNIYYTSLTFFVGIWLPPIG